MEKIFLCILLLLPAFGYAKKCEITEVKSCEVAAEQGDIDAQIALGGMYSLGMGVKQDVSQAAKWFQKAAEQGDVNAQFLTAQNYMLGKGVDKDLPQAMQWFHKAAEQGNASSQYFLALVYSEGLEGSNIELNKPLAKKMFGELCAKRAQKACEKYEALNKTGIQ
ncbi:TPA: tetratricopeptide repeat protein [Providencia rettgeri]